MVITILPKLERIRQVFSLYLKQQRNGSIVAIFYARILPCKRAKQYGGSFGLYDWTRWSPTEVELLANGKCIPGPANFEAMPRKNRAIILSED